MTEYLSVSEHDRANKLFEQLTKQYHYDKYVLLLRPKVSTHISILLSSANTGFSEFRSSNGSIFYFILKNVDIIYINFNFYL